LTSSRARICERSAHEDDAERAVRAGLALIDGLFVYRDLGAVEARGFTGTVPAWQVLRPSAVASRFEALRARSSTPLVGRGEELEFLART
jgi:hypothetical protein